jgi:hypothetical protein
MPRTLVLGLVSLLTLLLVQRSAHGDPPSFVNDVEPIFTRLGCNQGACHGKSAGQNGFRLSLRGYAPEWDYFWLTREFGSRRVNVAVPEASLILRKPLGQVPHEGGKLFSEKSREFQVLFDWIRAGAPGPAKSEPTVARLVIEPGSRVLKVGAELQLAVKATYTNGQVRDVTWLTQFVSNDASVAVVDPAGLVRVVRPGETSVRATFMGQVAVVVVTAPYHLATQEAWYAQRSNFIDDHVFKKLHDLHIEPSGPADDAMFLRRVYLDTIGLLPSPGEVKAFLADTRADKRARLIDLLLERPEFIDFWTLQLADLLQNRKESDHDVRGAKGVRLFYDWLRKQVAQNRPWNELAHDVLTAKGSTTDNPAVGYYIVTVGEQRNAEQSSVVASVAQTFLGTRIGCAQCHNHPLEKYTQDDYYHFAGYFSRVRLQRKDPKMAPTVLEVSTPDPKQKKSPVGVVQPRTGKFLAPQALDRSVSAVTPDDDPREILARWMTDPGNEHFSGAMVNRLWAHFMGVGLVEPVDDLRSSNPPTNPPLWKALIEEFVGHKFDRKHLMRVILNSRAYQLSSSTNNSNAADHRFYSHYYVRRLPAEVLLDCISRSTGVPDKFPGYPVGIRAVQVPDPSLKSHFMTLFGRSERITACACERTGDVTLPQLLHLLGGDTVLGKIDRIKAPEGRLAALLSTKQRDRDVMEELVLATLTRLPRAEEVAVFERTLQETLAAGDSRADFYRDLFWALLNSNEFTFNH